MRVPRNLLPFVLDEPSESLHSSKQSPLESPDCGVIPGDPTTCTSFESVEQFAAPECTSPTATMAPVTPTACSPVSPASYPDLCGTIESELVEESKTAKKKLMLQRLYSQLPVLFPVLVNVLLNKARS